MQLNELRELLAPLLQDTVFAGHTWFAGGCVRDGLLDPQAEVSDADISVELPQGGIRLAELLHRLLPTSIPELHPRFGTASSRFETLQLDFVMTRADTYFPGSRHPRVRFAPLSDDCLRRDFTVNALYRDVMSGELLDPCGQGLSDLKLGFIRSVRDPRLSFREDPLRVLRALRFASVLNFRLDEASLDAARELAPLVAKLSRARKEDELARLRSKASRESLKNWLILCSTIGLQPFLKTHLPDLPA